MIPITTTIKTNNAKSFIAEFESALSLSRFRGANGASEVLVECGSVGGLAEVPEAFLDVGIELLVAISLYLWMLVSYMADPETIKEADTYVIVGNELRARILADMPNVFVLDMNEDLLATDNSPPVLAQLLNRVCTIYALLEQTHQECPSILINL